MIEAFYYIGKELLSTELDQEKFLEYLTLELNKEKNKKKQHVVLLKIINEQNSSQYRLEIDFTEVSENSAREYLWVGNAPSANSEQDRLTTNNLEYLVSQTIPNLIKNLPDNSELKNNLKTLQENIFFDLGDKEEIGSKETQYNRYRFIWDLSKFGLNLTPEEVKGKIKNEDPKNKAKKAVKIVADELMKHIKEKTKLSQAEIALFTIFLNDNLLSQDKDYKKYLYDRLINEVFEEAKEGICHICNTNTNVTWDTTKFWFKFYITDKIGFSKDLEGGDNFLHNFSLCKNCYECIFIAQSFIRNNLNTSIGNFNNVYILPSFYISNFLPVKKIENWSKFFKDKFSSVVSLEGLNKFREKLEEYIEYQNFQDNFLLNFLFAEKTQAAFKIFQLIQDVPPSRLDLIREIAIKVQELGKKIFGENIQHNWYISLARMYYLFTSGEDNEKKNKFILSLYNHIFSQLSVNYNVLIKEFIKRILEIRFARDFNDFNFTNILLFQNMLIWYLDKLEILNRGEDMTENVEFLDNLKLREDVISFLKESKYSEKMTSLFLLGLIIGQIGIEQYKKGDKKKAILNKINFQGMDVNKLMRLYNDVFEKMRQYRLLSAEVEKIYNLSQNLFQKNKNEWNLTPQENVFYLLSGYSFCTYRAITAEKIKESSINEEGQNE